MSKISPQIRIYLSLFIAFFIIRVAPPLLVTSPYIPTKEELFQLIILPSFSLFTHSIITPREEVVLQPSPTEQVERPLDSIIIPTDIPPLPTIEIESPNNFPTSTPMPTITSIPTARPTPTIKPLPTPTPTKTLDYSALNAFVAKMPQIGCYNNTTSGCPVDVLYQTPLEKGLGWATYYGDEHNSGYNVVADVIHNNKGITVEAARAFINNNFMAKQSNLTPEEAKKTGKVIAYAATRTPKDLWKIKYMFGIDNVKNPQARFIGRIMIVDCAAPNDWKSSLSTLTYSYVGWTKLNWIVDLSKNGFIQLPTGYSGRQDNIGEGRPGVILIDEASLDGLIY